MDNHEIPFQVGPGGGVRSGSGDVASPDPPPLIKLSDEEHQVFDYICASLRAAGVEHMTAGMPVAIIVRKYKMWLDAVATCDEKGRHQTSASGWAQPTPWALDEARLATELGQWLPKACLTIPSLTRVRKDTGAGSGQDDLFADLVQHATVSPGASSPH